ncbi:MAG: hypothetical protein ACOCWQ_02595 [Nanoarchaeota archaeon]
MDAQEHHRRFREIIEKYNLEDQADRIAAMLTDTSQATISSEEFSREHAMTKEDAAVFLSFIRRALDFHESTSK